MVPTLPIWSKSRPTLSSSAVSTGQEEPPGTTALMGLPPLRIPPATL